MIEINKIRNYLNTKIGSSILIVYYGSRNRKDKYKGIILKTYRNIFTIRLCDGSIKSVSYNDIVTKTVQIYI